MFPFAVVCDKHISINPFRISLRALFRRKSNPECFSALGREFGNECQFIHFAVSVQVIQLGRYFIASFHDYGRLYLEPHLKLA